MIDVTTVFLLFSGIVFMGYMLNALFYRIKILITLPLLIIGLLLGPILHIVYAQGNSFIVSIASYVSAIAIAFILFDVGINIKISDMEFKDTSKFIFSLGIVTGLIIALALWLAFRWNLAFALIAGFAVSGPSSAIVPTLTRLSKANNKLKTALLFEGIATDLLQLIVPLLMMGFISTQHLNLDVIPVSLFDFIVMSSVIGIVSAIFWTFMLKSFKEQSEEYSWMLTITLVLATYGVAQALGFNGAIAVFVFGLSFVNIPRLSKRTERYAYGLQPIFSHIQSYQKEITFFISTFLFVYVGLLFTPNISFSGLLITVIVAALISAIILVLRWVFVPMLKNFFTNSETNRSEVVLAKFDVARGLSPIIIAILVASTPSLGAPAGFLDVIVAIVFITNIIETGGMFRYAQIASKELPLKQTKQKQ